MAMTHRLPLPGLSGWVVTLREGCMQGFFRTCLPLAMTRSLSHSSTTQHESERELAWLPIHWEGVGMAMDPSVNTS